MAQPSKSPERGPRIAKVCLTVGALVVLTLHLAVPDFELDTAALILLGLALIPWLGVVFESIDTPFGGVKYREITKRLDHLTGESASLRQVQEANEARERVSTSESVAASSSAGRLDELAAEYNRVRDPARGMRSGAERTAVMTKLVGEMIAAADAGATLQIDNALRGGDLGLRLAAYAVLYARPDETFTIPLVQSVIDLEPKPFGQFWGLRAIGRLLEDFGSRVIDLNTAGQLKHFRHELPPDSDRMFELNRILERLGV